MSDSQILTGAQALVVQHVNPQKRVVFANTAADDSEGVLVLPKNCQIPVYDEDLDDVCFAGHRPLNPALPAVGDTIMCVTEPGHYGKLFATAWTTARLWELADNVYQVIRIVDRGNLEIVWEGDGILELSALYPSNRWEHKDGTIWRSRDGKTVYIIVEVFYNETTDTNYDMIPDSDPRLPANTLPRALQGKSCLTAE